MAVFFIFAALYAFGGAIAVVVLSMLVPSLPPGVAILCGLVIFFVAIVIHFAVVTIRRIRQIDHSIVRLRLDSGELRDQQQRMNDSYREIATFGGSQKLDTVLSEVRIMQTVIDKILHGEKQTVIPAMIAVENMNDADVLDTVREAVRTDRIDIFTQPIVSLPQRKLRFYEIFSRIKTPQGGTLTPERYLQLAATNDADILPALDNLQLLRCIQMLRDTEKRNSLVRFFCNIASSTLRDSAFMTELVQFLGQNSTLAPKLVFEMSQTDLASLPADIFPLLDGLGRLGCRFSMDNVYSLDFPLSALQARKIRFVKVDADFLIAQIRSGKERDLSDLKTTLDRNNIDLICSKIESEQQLKEILDLNIDFGQGYLFGEPRADWPLS